MEPNREEALIAKMDAEKLFAEKDFRGAMNYALKAQMLFPELEGISQMVATFDVYIASKVKVNGEIDFYSILGLAPSAGTSKLKKQYKKMAVLLHPDKNKTVGADGAFKLVSDAWTLLSDTYKRSTYDFRRNGQAPSGIVQTNSSPVSHGLDTFWTVCTTCQVQYEYLRKYLNKRLTCKNCRGIFIAVETGTAPMNGSFPYSHWSYMRDSGYGSHAYSSGVPYVPTTSVYYTGNGDGVFHSGKGPEYVPNVSFQFSSFPGASAGVVDPHMLNTQSSSVSYHGNGNSSGGRSILNHNINYTAADASSNVVVSYEPSASKVRKVRGPYKKSKIDMGSASGYGNQELASKANSEMRMVDGNGDNRQSSKLTTPNDIPGRRFCAAPAFDARKLLMDKARTEICKKLEELKVASAAAISGSEKNAKACDRVGKIGERSDRELKKTGLMSITVPDSDFHDFDKDRSEECFKPKQIWAIYDEEDGMPRLYCLIREVISINPFKIHISYLHSKTDSEFGYVNSVDSWFTKPCGNFRAVNSEVVDQVNVFSHHMTREKVGRGGCIRIYPKSGDIWAVYRNWTPDWNRTTPDELRHQYEMVEVLDDFSEGVCVAPLVKLEEFKTVYQRNKNNDAIQWIPRGEMLRFSHQVPSKLLRGEGINLPDGCWDLDPAATPDDLLSAASKMKTDEAKSYEAENQSNWGSSIYNCSGSPKIGNVQI